jgi:hypothetical protein
MIVLNYISVIWGVILKWLHIKRDESVIPEGEYCYTPNYEKNTFKTLTEEGVYYIKPCKYFKCLLGDYHACIFIGCITNNFLLADQCKICGKNYGEENYT